MCSHCLNGFQNDQTTNHVQVIGGDDLASLSGKVSFVFIFSKASDVRLFTLYCS